MEITIRHVIEVSPELAALLERLVLALDGRGDARVNAQRPPREPGPAPAAQAAAGPPPEELPRQNAPPAALRLPQRTREREAILRRDWPAGVATKDLAAAINALSGAPMSNGSIAVWANALQLQRPVEYLATLKPNIQKMLAARGLPPVGAAAPPPPVAVAPAVPQTERPTPPPLPAHSLEDGKVYATFAEIRAWAGFYGFAYDGSNMDRLNKLRAAKGLPPLVQDDTRKAA